MKSKQLALSALLFILVFSVWNKPVMAQACLPTYSSVCTSDFINLVSTIGGTTNISNPNSGCNGVAPNNYTDFSATQFVTIAPGNSFTFVVRSGPNFGQGFRIFIDYSLDGDFLDPGEDVWNSVFSSTSAFTGSITVPLSASGITKMRVICTYAAVPVDPCPSFVYGEVEDYGIVFCSNQNALSAAFTANVVGATAIVNNTSTGAVTYLWNWGDSSPTDTLANPSHTYTQNGTYTITLIVSGGCGNDTITQTVTITQVGLQDVDLQNTLLVYPNPNGGLFTVQFELSTAKDVHVEVLDVQGRKVAEQRSESVLSYREQIDLSTAEPGVYVLRIITTDGVATQRIVLQR